MTALNPFGKYSDILTTLVAAFVIGAAVIQHLVPALASQPSSFIDDTAILALGAMFGKLSAANGYALMAVQAHKRLDAIGAPPAGDSVPTSSTPAAPVG